MWLEKSETQRIEIMTNKRRYSCTSLLIYKLFSGEKCFFRMKFYRELFLLAKNVTGEKIFTLTQIDSKNTYQRIGYIDQEMFDNN